MFGLYKQFPLVNFPEYNSKFMKKTQIGFDPGPMSVGIMLLSDTGSIYLIQKYYLQKIL